jgi:hypothetical protein
MQEPLKYARDCRRFVGYVIDHIPCSLIETAEMMKLNKKINDIWKVEFKNDMTTDHLPRT